MGQPITTDPLLIAAINITVVFCVLYGLSLIIRLIALIDPTKKKPTIIAEPDSVQKVSVVENTAMNEQEEYDEMIILFTAAIAAYGYSGGKITAIRPVGGHTWSDAGRMEGVNLRKGMF